MNKELIKEVEDILQDVEKTHRYSMSKIYGAYNKVFDKNETPQSCSSCLIRKVNELKKWLEAERKKQSDLVKSIGSHTTKGGNYKSVEAEKETNKLSELKAEYNNLSQEERDSEIGANILSEIERLTQGVKAVDSKKKNKGK